MPLIQGMERRELTLGGLALADDREARSPYTRIPGCESRQK